MTKQEFKDFCHEEFMKRGFTKRKKMYYLNGKDLLAGLYLQKSMAEAFYVEWDFFIGKYTDMKLYPTTYDADLTKRIEVLSKDTINGEHFMDACIEYELYTAKELKEYFDKAFEEHIMPPIAIGKEFLLQDIGYYSHLTMEEKNVIMKKIEEYR